MPSARLLLRIVLITVLCADGISGAGVTARMAVDHVSMAAWTGSEEGGTGGWDCDTDDFRHSPLPTAPASTPGEHSGCDCDGHSTCSCGCMLTFYPGRAALLFIARQLLLSVYLAPPLLPSVSTTASRLFRPPIG